MVLVQGQSHLRPAWGYQEDQDLACPQGTPRLVEEGVPQTRQGTPTGMRAQDQ